MKTNSSTYNTSQTVSPKTAMDYYDELPRNLRDMLKDYEGHLAFRREIHEIHEVYAVWLIRMEILEDKINTLKKYPGRHPELSSTILEYFNVNRSEPKHLRPNFIDW